jgi:UDP-N-acetylmuramoyl-L-alanyl-D-glutamate--2,6-diaminopimelate ligase
MAAAKFYPRQPATIAAVTGTSGKTSVAAFARQIWQRLGHASASIGTIGLVSPKRTIYGSLTTPDPIALHRQLDEIANDGVTHLALEASSHGLDQFRLDGVRIGACRATTWITTPMWRFILPPSSGCSANWSQPMALR